MAVSLGVLMQANGQLVFSDTLKNIKGTIYKVSYAVNKSEKDTFKYVYYNNTAKSLYTETIIKVPPKTCAITGFTQTAPVTKFQATTDKAITNELTARSIPYDPEKISKNGISAAAKIEDK